MSYQVDDLTIDVGQRQVSRDGDTLDIGGLTFDLFLAIVEAAPNIISSDELVEKVWSGRPTSPETITQRAMMLRQALGDDADHPRYIEVVRGQGLKLVPKLAKATPERTVVPPRNTKSITTGIAAVALVVVIAMFGRDFFESESPPDNAQPEPVRRYAMDLGELTSITETGGGLRSDIALSPDGSHLAYVGRYSDESTTHLYVRAMNQLDAKVIAGTEGARHPFFSPDGEWIGFDATETGIRKVSVRTGLRKTLTDDIYRMYGGSWSEDDNIVFSTTTEAGNLSGKLVKISANGGAHEDLLVADGGAAFRWPHFLPGGQSVLFSAGDQGFQMGAGDVALLSLESGEYRTLISGGYNAKYASTGHIVFTRNDTVWAVPFDIVSGEITGEESPLFDGLEHNSGPGAAIYDFSDDGLLVYLLGDDTNLNFQTVRYPVWVNREGNEEPVNVAPAAYWGPRISPDGKQAVVSVVDGENVDIWTIDLERETSSRLTFGAELDNNAFWSPDGDRIIYRSVGDSGGIFSRPADGTGSPELINSNDVATILQAVSPDGERVIVADRNRGESNMYLLSLSGESFPQPFVTTPFDEASAEISPDGDYVAYDSNETGNYEVYVRTFPNPDNGRWQISTEGGVEPMWGPDGDELFFRTNATGSIYVVDIETEPKFSMTQPRLLIEGNYVSTPNTYAVSADGERFLMFKTSDPPTDETPDGASRQDWPSSRTGSKN